ncbi:MAG: polyphosphate kinase 2 family protein [Candidatus Eremiobacteraeota bacterium]|nr:polyphosphate kinase 2 family protein [Candidatus Eremiobacteraeota bacterium]
MDATSYRWPVGTRAALKRFDPGDTGGYADKDAAKHKLKADIKKLAALQDVLAASGAHGILIILQGMDSAGKDSAIKHVMTGVNPQGVEVHGFREPTEEERKHDYLWRCVRRLPERGRIGIFNRSYFEEVLIVRVHPELLGQPLARHANAAFWRRRYREINDFERYLAENRIQVIKFFMHISKAEQAERLLDRLKRPDKHWKFSSSDVSQRASWDQYMKAYEDMLNATSTAWAPWYIIPADHKWFAHAVVADTLVRRLQALHLTYPRLDPAMRRTLRAVERRLKAG